MLMTWSDVVSGLLLVAFGWGSLRPDRPISLWAACCVGIWLLFAPILFWAPTAAMFLNDSLVGLLVIALTILIPGMPNMMKFMQQMGERTPPGCDVEGLTAPVGQNKISRRHETHSFASRTSQANSGRVPCGHREGTWLVITHLSN
ncbi:hypothetical protein GCM10027402_06390 [Arthrobacter monumenti]